MGLAAGLWRLGQEMNKNIIHGEHRSAKIIGRDSVNSDNNKIPYLITGGMAVFVWGRPRFTADIDLVVELSIDKLDVLEKSLKSLDEAGYVDIDVMREALAKSGEFKFIDGKTGSKVDFGFDRQFFRSLAP